MNSKSLCNIGKKIICSVATASLIACLALTGCGGDSTSSASSTEETSSDASTIYTLYIGTDSQSADDPLMDYEDAKQTIVDLALEYVGGYTIYDAQGGWTDEDGVPESEDSIVLVLVTDDDEAVHKIADEALKALDQTAILIESSSVNSEFYSGE